MNVELKVDMNTLASWQWLQKYVAQSYRSCDGRYQDWNRSVALLHQSADVIYRSDFVVKLMENYGKFKAHHSITANIEKVYKLA